MGASYSAISTVVQYVRPLRSVWVHGVYTAGMYRRQLSEASLCVTPELSSADVLYVDDHSMINRIFRSPDAKGPRQNRNLPSRLFPSYFSPHRRRRAVAMPPKGANAKKEAGRAKKAENESKKKDAVVAEKASRNFFSRVGRRRASSAFS